MSPASARHFLARLLLLRALRNAQARHSGRTAWQCHKAEHARSTSCVPPRLAQMQVPKAPGSTALRARVADPRAP